MKRIGLRFITLQILLLLAGFTVKGQGLSFGRTTLSRDTLQYFDTLTVSSSIINTDTASYYGTIDFLFKLNNQQNEDAQIFHNPFAGQLVQIPAGDSLHFDMLVIISSVCFEAGRDIMVVWPILPASSVSTDTDTISVYVVDPSAINNFENANSRVFYSNQHIAITNITGDYQTFIYTTCGQLLYSGNYLGNAYIPFDQQPNGVYLVEIRPAFGQPKMMRILKL